MTAGPPPDGDPAPGGGPAPDGPGAGRPRVVALVAAKDRADTVAATVAALRRLPDVDEVLVVDDGSTDDTSSSAARAGAWVLRLPENVGKGGAVAAAWPPARRPTSTC